MQDVRERRRRSTAAVRREEVLAAAVAEFAARGYHGTRTLDVAQRAGISHGYLFRLFGDKERLFCAVVERVFAVVGDTLAAAANGVTAANEVPAAADEVAGATPEAVLDALGAAYARLVADRDLLLVQLHAQAAAPSEPGLRAVVQAGYARMVDQVTAASGAEPADVQQFFARGMLCHLVVAIDAVGVDDRWSRTLTAGIRHPDADANPA